MIRHPQLLLTIMTALVATFTVRPAEGDVLWYAQPAEQWLEAMPLGNGLMGAMVFGRVSSERIALNESSFWSGRPHDYNNPDAHEHFAEIRDLVFAGESPSAEKLVEKHFYGRPAAQQAYQPLGDLILTSPANDDEVTDYRRELDMQRGVATVSYTAGGVRFTREVFVSHPDRVMVVRVSADTPGAVSLRAELASVYQDQVSATRETLVMDGSWKGPIPVDNWLIAPVEGVGMGFQTVLRAIPEGGEITADSSGLGVDSADAVTFLLTSATSHVNYQDIGGDPAARCAEIMAAVEGMDHRMLRERHEKDFTALMSRVSLDVGGAERNSQPTDKRILAMREGGEDRALEALAFQFGRYILASGSRAGGQPVNLQGIWNESVSPTWGSKYTININTQMNYWPAEVTNLAECHEPLFGMIRDISINGAKTAKIYYDCDGWVTHHNTDLWRGTAPVDAARYGMWPMGGAWLSLHLWEHYAFSGDVAFLKESYPIMKGAARFLLEVMVEHPKYGWMVTPFSISPEIGYMDDQGRLAHLSPSPTMDVAIIRELFARCIESAAILDDGAFATELESALNRLPPYRVNAKGGLQEWIEDWEPDAGHGHNMSPYFAFFPGTSIHTGSRPELVTAIHTWMDGRARGGGWPLSWDICLWARLGEDGKVADGIRTMVANSLAPNLHNRGSNQSDASFGLTAAIAEALLQSHLGEIHLLPALPASWPDGSITGLRARGGFEVSMAWKDGELQSAEIRASRAGTIKIRHGKLSCEIEFSASKPIRLDGDLKIM